jgi:hypothetical protein
MHWRPLLPKEGGLIKEDLGGHPPCPIGSNFFFWQLTIFSSFSVPELPRPF